MVAELAPGTYTLLVFVDDQPKQPKQVQLEVVYPDLLAAFTSPRYLEQALGLPDLHQLDLRLKVAFNRSLPADRGLDHVFPSLPAPDPAGTSVAPVTPGRGWWH